MNTTPENVPDETLLQAKVVRAQLLIKTNTRNIVHEVRQIHMMDLEIRTMQIGEFELMVQLDLEDCISGKSLVTIGHFKPTGDALAKLQQRIDTDIDTLYRIVQELPGINQTVHDLTGRMDRQPAAISSMIKVLFFVHCELYEQ